MTQKEVVLLCENVEDSEKEVVSLCENFEKTIQNLLNDLTHIKSNLCSGGLTNYDIQLEQSIILYYSLDDLVHSYSDFLKYHNKFDYFNSMKEEIHQYILFFKNYKDSIDCVFNISREQIVQWCFSIKDIINSFADEQLDDLAYKDCVEKIRLLNTEFKNILVEESYDIEFDFNYIHPTKEYILFLSVVYDILCDIRSYNVNPDIKEDSISILLSMPNKYLLNKIFQG